MILIEHHVMVKVNNISRFFRDEIEIFSNLVVRDEIEICFFYISCFETRSRICFTTSRISRRGRETKQLILEVEREFSMLILARHFEIENSRQCLVWYSSSPNVMKQADRHRHRNPIWWDSWSRGLIGSKLFRPKATRLAHLLCFESLFFCEAFPNLIHSTSLQREVQILEYELP